MQTTRFLAVAAMFAAVSAQAQTARVEWRLTDQNGAQISTHSTQTACDTAAKARNRSMAYTCPRYYVVTGAAPAPAPAPAPSPTPAPAPSPAPAPAPSPAPAPAPAPTPAPAPAPTGPVVYVSDTGNDANPGTITSPKRSAAAVVNTLPAGGTVLLARGGTYGGLLDLFNQNATAAAPITIDAYGTGAAPIWRATNNAVEVGREGDPTRGIPPRPITGGYTIRNVKFDGGGTGNWGMHFRGLRNVVLEDVEITGFKLGIHAQQPNGLRNSGLTLRRVYIHHNSEMGMLGEADSLLIEDSTFAANNYSGSPLNHGIYLGGTGRNAAIRNTTFDRNSAVNGRCTGGNLTMHGQWDGVLFENIRMVQDSAADSCYGISVIPGYDSAEWVNGLVIRGNRISNVGLCSICVAMSPGAVIENNVAINDRNSSQTAVVLPAQQLGSGDAADRDAVVRGNVACFTQPGQGSGAARVTAPGSTVDGNVMRTGADATTGVCAR